MLDRYQDHYSDIEAIVVDYIFKKVAVEESETTETSDFSDTDAYTESDMTEDTSAYQKTGYLKTENCLAKSLCQIMGLATSEEEECCKKVRKLATDLYLTVMQHCVDIGKQFKFYGDISFIEKFSPEQLKKYVACVIALEFGVSYSVQVWKNLAAKDLDTFTRAYCQIQTHNGVEDADVKKLSEIEKILLLNVARRSGLIFYQSEKKNADQ